MDQLTRRLYISTHQTVLPTLLRNYDRYSMANGVEIRMPFLDHRIACFAFALPWSSKIRDGYSKAIVRDAVARYMPSEIAYRKSKIGFNSPIVDWMKGPLREFLLDTISRQDFGQSALIDAEAPSGDRRTRMVASFNRGYRSFQQTYRTCTPAADLVIRRYLEEGSKIARDVTARYAN